MKLIVGLGNIGEEYKLNRHNVGFMFLDKLAKAYDLDFFAFKKANAFITKNDHLMLAKPTTMMNSSGSAVAALVGYYNINLVDLYIIHDDLDINLGEYKIQKGKGPALHNGVNDIEQKLGNESFWRVRIGVDNRDLESRIPGEEYVLQNFTEIEKEKLELTFGDILTNMNI